MRALALLAVVACGDNTSVRVPYEATSGDRIQLLTYTYSDGTKQRDANVFLDRARQEHCGVQRWSDGNTYCTPTAHPTVYTDPGCVDGEVGRWLASEIARHYFYREYTLNNGEVISRLFARGQEIDAPLMTYELANGRCVATSSAGWTYYALGPAVTQEQLARVKRRTANEGDERLGLDAYTTDDGLYVPVESGRPLLVDRELGFECKVIDRPNAPGTTCEPLFAAEPEFSRDSRCVRRDVLVVEAGVAVPDVLVEDAD